MGARRLSEALRRDSQEVWDACRAHPFVRALGDGTLSHRALEAWVRQDYRFLEGYARALALAGARAPDLGTAARLVAAAHATLDGEMALHPGLAAALGLGPPELAATPPGPVTAAYTDHLLCLAALGGFAELVAGLLPCLWSYAEIGADLARAGLPADPLLHRVAATYADPHFHALAAWACTLVDRLGAGADPMTRRAMQRAFAECLVLERRFWDQVYGGGEPPGSGRPPEPGGRYPARP